MHSIYQVTLSSLYRSQTAFGVTIAGEFSDGYNDCGLYLMGVGNTGSYGESCSLFLDSSQWNATMKAGFYEFTLASMDALQNWFFWTWKVGLNLCIPIKPPLIKILINPLTDRKFIHDQYSSISHVVLSVGPPTRMDPY